jgi:hypothetical protein
MTAQPLQALLGKTEFGIGCTPSVANNNIRLTGKNGLD